MAFLVRKKANAAPAQAEETAAAASPSVTPRRKRSKKKLVLIITAAVLAVVVAVSFLLSSRGRNGTASATYTLVSVARRDITLSLSGTGTLTPANTYAVTTLASGDILKADFEEGDVVKEGDVLYTIDSTNAQTNVNQAEVSLQESQKNYERKLKSLENLSVRSDIAGTVISINVKKGDTVQNGQLLATVRNSSTMSLKVPFISSDAASIREGGAATVTLDGTFETLKGTVSGVSAVDEVTAGGVLVRQVTIDVSNPGGIQTGASATAAVGGLSSASGGTFDYKDVSNITAKASGEVTALNVKEGAKVSAGQLLLTLESDALEAEVESAENALEKAKNELENQADTLDNYTVTSPSSGTVVSKYYKAGDTLEGGKSLCVIYDLSYLTMTLNIDELDISKVSVGQKVSVTAEAAEGKTYSGVVTKVSINGTTNGNATTYPITIRIDETEGLLPGMNVDAEIVIKSSENVLTVPVSALTRGNLVLVPKDQASSAPSSESPNTPDAQGAPDGANLPGGQGFRTAEAPDGYQYVEVKTGLSDDDYIEITSGLKEGDKVAIANRVATNGAGGLFGAFGQQGSRMPQGGPSSGGDGFTVSRSTGGSFSGSGNGGFSGGGRP